MERQAHGFSFEQRVCEKYGVKLNSNYTDKWDGELNNIPVSIKLEKNGSDIEMADIFRNMSISSDFYLIVGFWENDKTNIIKEYVLYIDHKDYEELFNFNMIEKFKNLLNNISNDKSDDVKWKSQITSLRKEWKETTPNLIRPRFKRDHKSQKRIQCAINNKDFYNYFLNKYEVKL